MAGTNKGRMDVILKIKSPGSSRDGTASRAVFDGGDFPVNCAKAELVFLDCHYCLQQ
jgi:hypothetical protein